jgi:hypothetical protein
MKAILPGIISVPLNSNDGKKHGRQKININKFFSHL